MITMMIWILICLNFTINSCEKYLFLIKTKTLCFSTKRTKTNTYLSIKNKNKNEKENFERFCESNTIEFTIQFIKVLIQTPCNPIQTSATVLMPVLSSLMNVAVSRIQKTPITTKRRTNNISLKRKWIWIYNNCILFYSFC